MSNTKVRAAKDHGQNCTTVRLSGSALSCVIFLTHLVLCRGHCFAPIKEKDYVSYIVYFQSAYTGSVLDLGYQNR